MADFTMDLPGDNQNAEDEFRPRSKPTMEMTLESALNRYRKLKRKQRRYKKEISKAIMERESRVGMVHSTLNKLKKTPKHYGPFVEDTFEADSSTYSILSRIAEQEVELFESALEVPKMILEDINEETENGRKLLVKEVRKCSEEGQGNIMEILREKGIADYKDIATLLGAVVSELGKKA